MQGEILEELAKEAKCCLSDLRYCTNQNELFQHLKKFETKGFSLREWSYSLSYITSQNLNFTTAEQIDAFLNHGYSE